MTGESNFQGDEQSDAEREAALTTGIPPATPPAVDSSGLDTTEPAPPAEPAKTKPAKPEKPASTIAARVWVAIGVAVVLLVLLIIFIAENSGHVTVKFLGAKGTLSLALMMLISALAGVVITLLVGTARILQLRREVRRRS